MAIGSPCAVQTCDRALTGRGEGNGMCTKHYQRLRRHGDPLWEPKGRAVCSIDGCALLVVGRGWCSKHHTRWTRYGNPTVRLRGEVVDGKKVCARCGEDKAVVEFTRLSDPCRECQAALMRKRREESPTYSPVVRIPKVCDCCGLTFPADARRSRYCSTRCNQLHRNLANWKHVAKRRARMRAAFVEVFDRIEIFERDGWQCGLCGGLTDREAVWPDQQMPSVDHILPISRGGLHERSNVQTTHLGCNVRKGNRAEVAA